MPILLLVVIVWLLKRTHLAKWSWNPLDWWNSAANAGQSILNDVKNWVLGIVSDAVNLVENDVLTVWQWAGTALAELQGLIGAVDGYLGGIIDGVIHWAGQQINAVEALANRWVSDLSGWAHAAIDAVQGLAYRWVSDLGAWVTRGLGELQGLIGQGLSDLGGWVRSAFTAAYDWVTAHLASVTGWVEDQLRKLWGDLYSAVFNDFIKPIEDVVRVVKEAWDWVTWFAAHPFQAMHNLETDVIDWEHHAIEDVEHVVRGGDFRKGMEAFGRFLGG